MTQSTLRTIWIALALLLLIFIFNMYSGTQKSVFALVIKLPIEFKPSDRLVLPVEYALHGLRMTALFFWIIPCLAWLHARGEAGSVASAFPFRLLDIVPSSRPGWVVQGIAIMLLIVAPFFGAYHFWKKIEVDGRICTSDQTCVHVYDLPIRWSGWWDHKYRFNDGHSPDGPSYEPMLEPILAVVLLSVALVFTVALANEMVLAARRGTKQDNIEPSPEAEKV